MIRSGCQHRTGLSKPENHSQVTEMSELIQFNTKAGQVSQVVSPFMDVPVPSVYINAAKNSRFEPTFPR